MSGAGGPASRVVPSGPARDRAEAFERALTRKPARAAKAPCILFSFGYTPIPAKDLGADIVLDDFADLPGALKTLKLL